MIEVRVLTGKSTGHSFAGVFPTMYKPGDLSHDSSHVQHISLYEFTDLVQTWRSFIGFQSCSTKITVSAPVRFRPSPPTCVVNSRMSIDGSLLNL